MSRTAYCKYCNKEIIDKTQAIKKSQGWYHDSCLELVEEEKKKCKQKKVLANGKPNPRRQLTDYIQELYIEQGYNKEAIPWNMLCAQIKNMIDEYGYSYQSIKYVLWYEVDILDFNLFNEAYNGSILNLIPYHFQEAKDFFEKSVELKKEIEQFDFNDEVVVINKTFEKEKKKNELTFD